MKSAVLFTVITPALALLPACMLAPWSSVQGGRGADREDSLTAPEGYRAELHPTPWALDGVSKDGTVVWIRTAERVCVAGGPGRSSLTDLGGVLVFASALSSI